MKTDHTTATAATAATTTVTTTTTTRGENQKHLSKDLFLLLGSVSKDLKYNFVTLVREYVDGQICLSTHVDVRVWASLLYEYGKSC